MLDTIFIFEIQRGKYMDYILEEMNNVDADGVDFVPIWFDEHLPPPIICSYTKEELKNITGYPKSNRMYWKIINGKKEYIRPDQLRKNLKIEGVLNGM